MCIYMASTPCISGCWEVVWSQNSPFHLKHEHLTGPELQRVRKQTGIFYQSLTMATKQFRVGIILGSQRKPRAGNQITAFIEDIIKARLLSLPSDVSATLEIVDIGALDLPLLDEPGIPSQIKSAEGYVHEHTRAWSRRIAALDAFVFVTPQYNWGIPAGLKNAIDYLFNEWKGKPAMVVSYGGHGGDKAASALSLVLGGGIHMKVVPETVNMMFPDRQFLVKAATGKDLGLDATVDDGIWNEKREEILKAWDAMVNLLIEDENTSA
jgi:NAD(P)H-dependent FMN reductase